MIIQGIFSNNQIGAKKKRFFVRIGNTGRTINIVDNTINLDLEEDEIICFGSDPVTISVDNSDTFTNIYFREATINLIANFDVRPYVIAEFYTTIPVDIRLVDETDPDPDNYLVWDCVFRGYVEPLVFDQSFALPFNEFSLTCVDTLALTQYLKYPELETLEGFGYKTPREIIDIIFGSITGVIVDSTSYDITYDGDNSYDFTSDTYINDSVFAGKSPDDYMDCREVLDLLGRIYGFWTWQDGNHIYFKNIFDMSKTQINIGKQNYAGNDFSLSVMEGYNQLRLSCALEDGETDLFTLFDNDSTYSTFPRMDKYLTEYIAPGEGYNALDAFKKMVKQQEPNDYKDGPRYYDHYMWIKQSKTLNFGATGTYCSLDGGYAGTDNGTTQQWKVLNWLDKHPGKAGIISFGHTDNLFNPKNSSEPAAPSLTDYLLISVKGQDDNSTNGHINTIDAQITANSPIFTYTYPTIQNFIPNDSGTTNYLVISGGLYMNPIQLKTGTNWPNDTDSDPYHDNSRWPKSTNMIQNVKDVIEDDDLRQNYMGFGGLLWHHTVPHQDNEDGAYYQQRWWTRYSAAQNQNYIALDENPNISETHFTYGPLQQNDKNKDAQYKYSSAGNSRDEIKKLAVLAARIKIGTEETGYKYCVERLDLGSDGMNVFEWREEDNLPLDGDGNVIDYFTIGVDPKIDDYLIGQKYDNFSSNQTIEMNIGERGMAIPIKMSDHLMGEFTFELLGPYNSIFDYVDKKVKRKWLFWQKTNWTTNEIPLLEKLENILISSMKIKLTSDNGGYDNNIGGNDLIYSTDEVLKYINDKEWETTFCTCLTSEEAKDLGVDWTLNNSGIMIENEEEELEPFTGFDYVENPDTEWETTYENTKLEELRLKEQYNIWKKPRTVTKATYKIDWTNADPSKTILPNTYKFNYLRGLNFWPVGREIDLKYDTDLITMIDIADD